MKLNITYQGQKFTASTNAEAFGDALTELFQNPNYCLTTDTDNQTVAYGTDLLRGSIITTSSLEVEPGDEEGLATPQQYDAGKACFDRLIDLASNLISLVGQDERYIPMGAFNPDWEKMNELRLISTKTYGTVRGSKSVYFNTSVTDHSISARIAQEVVDSCPEAEDDLNRAIEAWRIQHP